MVTDVFGVILQEIGKNLQVADLHPDRNNSCLIKLKNGLHVQMEIDRTGQFLILGSDLGAPPPGRLREALFKEALRANGLPPPRNGIFAYSTRSEHVVIYESFNLKDLNGEKVVAVLEPFAEKAFTWKEAIAKGDIPPVHTNANRPAGMFGLSP